MHTPKELLIVQALISPESHLINNDYLLQKQLHHQQCQIVDVKEDIDPYLIDQNLSHAILHDPLEIYN